MANKLEFKARAGDHVHLHSRKRRGIARHGEIAEVRGKPGSEYYLVRWPNGHESLIHPGLGVTIPEVDTRARDSAGADDSDGAAPRKRTPRHKKPKTTDPFELHKPTASSLHAEPGDRLVIRSRRLDGLERDAEILEVTGKNGQPPYRVRWSDTGRETITRPGSDAYVDHLHSKAKKTPKGD